MNHSKPAEEAVAGEAEAEAEERKVDNIQRGREDLILSLPLESYRFITRVLCPGAVAS